MPNGSTATSPVDSPANRAQFEAVGAHLARVVAATRGWFCDDGEVVQPRTVLNVNYPAPRRCRSCAAPGWLARARPPTCA